MRIVFGKDKELEKAIKQGRLKDFENFLLRKLLEQAMEKLKAQAEEEDIIERKDSEIFALNLELERLKRHIAGDSKPCDCVEATPKKRGRKKGSKNGTTKKQ